MKKTEKKSQTFEKINKIKAKFPLRFDIILWHVLPHFEVSQALGH